MKKFTTVLILFVLGMMLCPTGQIFAEEENDDEISELYNSASQVSIFDVGVVNLEEDSEPEPDTEPGE